MDSPLAVEIVDDCILSASRIHRGCVLNLLIKRFSIDLVSIPLREWKVIIEINWLVPSEPMIDCEHQMVRVQTPSMGEPVILGESASYGPVLCSAARARRY